MKLARNQILNLSRRGSVYVCETGNVGIQSCGLRFGGARVGRRRLPEYECERKDELVVVYELEEEVGGAIRIAQLGVLVAGSVSIQRGEKEDVGGSGPGCILC
jgi:hypothetical protein